MIKLEVGKSYKTRGGWKAIIVNDDETSTPLYIKHCTPDGVTDIWHYRSGKSNIFERDYDIIAEWEEPVPEVDLTKIEKPFGLLDKDTQERLKVHGGPYEWVDRGGWLKCVKPVWAEAFTYRVKPKPFVEYKKTLVNSYATCHQYIVTEKFVDGKYDSYTVDMVPF